MTKKKSPTKTSTAIALFFGTVALVFGPVLTPMLAITWHYLLCFGLLLWMNHAKKKGNQKLADRLCIYMTAAAVAGFLLVYGGPFAQSGKTLLVYCTRYAFFTLPILLLPAAGFYVAGRRVNR